MTTQTTTQTQDKPLFSIGDAVDVFQTGATEPHVSGVIVEIQDHSWGTFGYKVTNIGRTTIDIKDIFWISAWWREDQLRYAYNPQID